MLFHIYKNKVEPLTFTSIYLFLLFPYFCLFMHLLNVKVYMVKSLPVPVMQ